MYWIEKKNISELSGEKYFFAVNEENYGLFLYEQFSYGILIE